MGEEILRRPVVGTLVDEQVSVNLSEPMHSQVYQFGQQVDPIVISSSISHHLVKGESTDFIAYSVLFLYVVKGDISHALYG